MYVGIESIKHQKYTQYLCFFPLYVDSTLNLVGSTIFFSFSFRYPWSSASSTEYSCYKNLSNQRTSYLYNHNTICINNHLIVSLIKLIHTSTTLFSTKNIFCTKYNYKSKSTNKLCQSPTNQPRISI